MTQKLLYTAPAADPLVVQAEGLICGSLNYGTPGNPGSPFTEDIDHSYDL